MANVFSTIHIFGFGIAQVITKDKNIQTPISNVQSQVDACVDNIWSKKPQDNTCTKQYHAINIFDGMFADFQAKIKGEKGFRTQYSELDKTLFENLANAILATEVTPAP